MPQPQNIRRVTINAALQEGEKMTHVLHVKDVEATGSGVLQNLANGIRDIWTTMLTDTQPGTSVKMASLLAPTTVYTDVFAYDLNETTGLVTDIAGASFGTTAKGTSTDIRALPTEVALAVTLRTAVPGRRGTGRVYLGGFAANCLSEAGRLNAQSRNTVAEAFTAFALNVKDIEQGGTQQDVWNLCVASFASGLANRVTEVSVGDVFDVQRRRRDSLREVRSNGAVTY